MGIWFLAQLSYFFPNWIKILIRVPETTSYKYSTHNFGFGYVKVILHNWAKNLPIMGVAALRAPVGSWGLGSPQKFGHGYKFVGQLLS